MKRIERFGLAGRVDLIDATRVNGGRFVLCTGSGNVDFGPLAPPIGETITVWVRGYCAVRGCKQRVAEVEEWTADSGQRVVLFRGRHFTNGPDGKPKAEATYALLEPSHGTPLRTSCPNHGPLKVSESEMRSQRADGQYRQQSRSGAATRKVNLQPVDEDTASRIAQ